MFCRSCGQTLTPGAAQCPQCGAPQSPPSAVPPGYNPGPSYVKVSSHLVPAILTTVFCCLPTGIVAIVYAAQVDSKARAGDLAGAESASGKAMLWIWISLGLGLVGTILGIVVSMMGSLANM